MNTMLDAARILLSSHPQLRFLLPVAPGLPVDWVRELLGGGDG